jgi:uncharacterized membrane protein YdcZ (DUF606 family)
MIYWIFSIALGFAAVIQAGLNRQISKDWGLSSAVLINSAIIMVIVTVYWLLTPHPKFQWDQLKLWYLVPALCGLCFVAGIPLLIPRLGAMPVFLCIVVGQLAFSLLWDTMIEGAPFEWRRLIGAGVALGGLLIATVKG